MLPGRATGGDLAGAERADAVGCALSLSWLVVALAWLFGFPLDSSKIWINCKKRR